MRIHRLVLGFGALLLASFPALAEKDKDNVAVSVGVSIGIKNLDDSWAPLGDQLQSVISVSVGGREWPVQVALDYVSAKDTESRIIGFPLLPPFCCYSTEVEAESKISEWDLGVRRVWRRDKAFRPVVGGGIAFVSGSLRIDSQGVQESGSTTGYWVDVGFRRRLSQLEVLEWGIDVRHTDGAITLGATEVEAGGTSISLYMGGSW